VYVAQWREPRAGASRCAQAVAALVLTLALAACQTTAPKAGAAAAADASAGGAPDSSAVHTRAVLPTLPTAGAPLQVVAPPAIGGIAPIAWTFPNIRLTAMGPNSVKIEWAPLTGADNYCVYRGSVQLACYSAAPTTTQPFLVYDNAAPANTTLSYYVTARHLTTTVVGGLQNTPNAGQPVTTETLMANSNTVSVTTPVPPLVLHGAVDLHTHPMAHLAFGGKLLHGGTDVGSLMPAGQVVYNPTAGNWSGNPTPVQAASIEQALSDDRCTHGSFDLLHPCGNLIRHLIVNEVQQQEQPVNMPDPAAGADGFPNWPVWQDITHQKMYIDWIWRAYFYGGLRVMVALAVNNKTLATGALGLAAAAPGDPPIDDVASADLQIAELKNFVYRHRDFMEIAYSSADLARIVAANHLAVVIGVEIDALGDFYVNSNPTSQQITNELNRLVGEGVRYAFPIHVIDNAFGGAALYEPLFLLANVLENGKLFGMECAAPASGITWQFPLVTDLSKAFNNTVSTISKVTGSAMAAPQIPICSAGHQNARRFTAAGATLVKEMMRRGMLIDIDHMDQYATSATLAFAESIPGGYPVSSGHNGLRGNTIAPAVSENSRSASEYARIAKLHGMIGIGTGRLTSAQWLEMYRRIGDITSAANGGITVPAGFGTDTDGLVPGMPPRPGSAVQYSANFPISQTGSQTWDYNSKGVAHYGMLADYLQDMRSLPAETGEYSGAVTVDQGVMLGADYFWHMWQKAEQQSAHVPP
jgi:microsomal dipeptidase-like Zn-dependent dipeptidase